VGIAGEKADTEFKNSARKTICPLFLVIIAMVEELCGIVQALVDKSDFFEV